MSSGRRTVFRAKLPEDATVAFLSEQKCSLRLREMVRHLASELKHLIADRNHLREELEDGLRERESLRCRIFSLESSRASYDSSHVSALATELGNARREVADLKALVHRREVELKEMQASHAEISQQFAGHASRPPSPASRSNSVIDALRKKVDDAEEKVRAATQRADAAELKVRAATQRAEKAEWHNTAVQSEVELNNLRLRQMQGQIEGLEASAVAATESRDAAQRDALLTIQLYDALLKRRQSSNSSPKASASRSLSQPSGAPRNKSPSQGVKDPATSNGTRPQCFWRAAAPGVQDPKDVAVAARKISPGAPAVRTTRPKSASVGASVPSFMRPCNKTARNRVVGSPDTAQQRTQSPKQSHVAS